MLFRKHVPIRERDDPYYHCACGIHVHKGASIVAVIGIIFSLLSIGAWALMSLWFFIPGSFISLLLFTGVYLGRKMEKPALYLPFIIIYTVGVVLCIAMGIFFVLSGAAITTGGFLLTQSKSDHQAFGYFAAFTISFGVILALWGLVSAYFVRVIYRAYRFLKDVIAEPHLHTLPTSIDPVVQPIVVQPVV